MTGDEGEGERQRAGGRGSQGEGERQRAGGRGSQGEGERQRAGGRGSQGEGDEVFAVLGWDEQWAGVFATLPGEPARVTRMDHGRARTMTQSGPVAATPSPDVGGIVTGDWVAVQAADDGSATVTARAPRRTALVRRDPGEEPAPQVLAANMDQVWIAHAASHALRAAWLDRVLVVAYGSGAMPVLVVTKADLASDTDALVTQVTLLAPGLTTVITSVVDGRGVDALTERLQDGRCAALLGRSGSGKSSLVNTLSGVAEQRTATVRAADGRGRHTTTRRALVPIAGGSVIDTPGVRALGLWEPEDGLRLAFPDISELAQHCRFNDCQHEREPDCAVLQARDAGALSPERVRRYITLRNSDATQRR